MILDLPRPPSVNRIWRHRAGRVKPYIDHRYATWKRHCDNLCMAHRWHKTPVRGHYVAVITLDDSKRRGDADNRVKPVLDWLKQAGITDDDKLCDDVRVRWGYAPSGCRVEITASSLPLEKAA